MTGRHAARWGSILTAIVGAIGAAWNTARLTVPDTAAGPVDFATYAGIPALLAAAGAAGAMFIRPARGTADKPGSPGHREFCDSLYQLALACDWDRMTANIAAWKSTNPPALSTSPPGGGGAA